nr:proline-rich transmembrane protein 4 [Anolis sagrei ordinatus]
MPPRACLPACLPSPPTRYRNVPSAAILVQPRKRHGRKRWQRTSGSFLNRDPSVEPRNDIVLFPTARGSRICACALFVAPTLLPACRPHLPPEGKVPPCIGSCHFTSGSGRAPGSLDVTPRKGERVRRGERMPQAQRCPLGTRQAGTMRGPHPHHSQEQPALQSLDTHPVDPNGCLLLCKRLRPAGVVGTERGLPAPWRGRPMRPWPLLLLLCLPPLDSRTHLQDPPGPQNGSAPSAAPAETPSPPPATSSEAPSLSLNLGLNFKFKVRSQGKARAGEGSGSGSSGTPSAKPRLAPTRTPGQAKTLWPEAVAGSGWPGPGAVSEDPPPPPPPSSGSVLWPWGSPTLRPPLPLWPKLTERGLTIPLSGEGAADKEDEGKELEFKIDIDLTAGLGKDGTSNGSSSNGSNNGGRRFPIFPGFSLGISEIASKLGAPGLFGAPLPSQVWEPPEWNGTGGGESPPTPEWILGPGLASSIPGSEGSFAAALPGCLPGDRPADCGSPLPALSSSSWLLQPSVPLFVPLHSDWNSAQAAWGPAWEAHVFGAGSLFALMALLSLLALLALPCRCPASCKLLALLHLLLTAAGAARALLLFGEACGQLELLPDIAVRLLHDLALPCLTSALATALLLLSRRSQANSSSARAAHRLRHPCLLAGLMLLHFSVATGAVLAADLLQQFSFLLLASRGLFALLAAILSCALLVFLCVARVDKTQAYDLKATSCPQCPFGDVRRWKRAARVAVLSAFFGLLTTGLHSYAILHALGFGLNSELFSPWPWWALQLAGRLCEAGMGLPLACLGLCPLFCSASEPWCRCCRCCCRDRSPDHGGAKAAKAQLLPNNFQWSLSQHEKLVICDTVIARSESDYLPLYTVSDATPDTSLDPTVDFRPPSPIDLRRSIDEALCGEGFFPEGGPLYAPSTFSLCLTSMGSGPSRVSSCLELEPSTTTVAAGGSSVTLSVPDTPMSSPGPWRGASTASIASSSGNGSPCKHCSTAEEEDPSSSLPVAPDPSNEESPPRSPPPPGRQFWVLTPVSQHSLASMAEGQPAVDTALLQKEFMAVCRQIDTLSVSSETIDL